MSKVKVLVEKIDDDHLDSFWYDGIIAEAGELRLYAAGEILINQLDEDGDHIGSYDGKARDDFDMPENDEELQELFSGDGKYDVVFNNWFEVVDEHGDCVGDICDDYEGGIDWLTELANG